MVTDRELASGILLAAFAVVLFSIPTTRRNLLPAVADIARQLVGPKVLAPFLALFAWAALCVWGATVLHAWDVGLLKDTVLTVVLVGLPQVVFALTRAKHGGDILHHLRRETVGLGVLAIAYINLVSFPLWLELVVQVVAALAIALKAAAKLQQQPEGAGCAGKVGRGLLVVIGLGSIAWTTVQLIQQAAVFGWWPAIASVILTVWLPLALFPFLYAFGFVAATEVAWVRLTFPRHTDLPRKVFLAVLVGLRFRVGLAKKFPGRHRDVAEATGYRDGLRRMSAFRRDTQQREEAEEYRVQVLEQFAGVSGTDDQGLQRDRREFEGTKKLLESITYYQSGQYSKRKRYWNDESGLYPLLIDWERNGLPEAHGVVVQTTAKGQTWRAFRRLPNAWYFGAGGTGMPYNAWYYSGATAPSGWPGDDTGEWVNGAVAMRQPDWEHDDASRL